MTYPVPWHNELGFGLTLGPVPDPTWDMSFDGVDYPPGYVPEKADCAECVVNDTVACHRCIQLDEEMVPTDSFL